LKNIKFIPKILTALSTLITTIFVIILFLGRRTPFFNFAFLSELFEGFYLHVSNFAISYLILFGVGYAWLLIGIPLKYISMLAGIMLLCNFIYELFIPVLNTPDVVDAYYGLIGVISAYLYLLVIKKVGLNKVEDFK